MGRLRESVGHWDTVRRWVHSAWEGEAIRWSVRHDMRLWVHVAAGTRPRIVEASVTET